MAIATRPYFRTGGNFGSPKMDLGGCVFYAPLWREDMRVAPDGSVLSKGVYGIPTRLCTVIGTIWTPQGYSFDNTDDKITVPANASITPRNGYTILFWQKSSALTDYRRPLNWDKGDSANRFFFFCFSNALAFTNENADVVDINVGLGSFTNWTLVSATFNAAGNYASFALNGVETTRDFAYTLADFSTTDLLLGFQNNTVFGSWIILTRALSTAELTSIYLATKWRYV